MKTYVVMYNIAGSKPDVILRKATNKKEAIEYVWNNYYVEENKSIDTSKGFELFRKKDLYATELDDLFKNANMFKI